jgi:hypothetical protein
MLSPKQKNILGISVIVAVVIALISVMIWLFTREKYDSLIKMGYFGPYWNFPFYPYRNKCVPMAYLNSGYYTPPLGQQEWKKYGLATTLGEPLDVWELQYKFNPITGLSIYRIVKGRQVRLVVQNRSLENEDVIWTYKNPDRPMVVSLVPY